MLQVKMLTPAPQTSPGAIGDETRNSLPRRVGASPCGTVATDLSASGDRSVWPVGWSEICTDTFNLKLRPSGAGSAWFQRSVRRTDDRSVDSSGGHHWLNPASGAAWS